MLQVATPALSVPQVAWVASVCGTKQGAEAEQQIMQAKDQSGIWEGLGLNLW